MKKIRLLVAILALVRLPIGLCDGTPDEYAYHPRSEMTEQQKQTEAMQQMAREIKRIEKKLSEE